MWFIYWKKKTREEKLLEEKERELLRIARLEAELLDQERLAPLNLGVPEASLAALKKLILEENILKTEVAIQAAKRNLTDRVTGRQKKIADLEKRLREPLFLEVLYPAAGVQCGVGDFLEIQWVATGPLSDDLTIDLYCGDTMITNIAIASANKGKFSWEIPDRPPRSGKKGQQPSQTPLPIPPKVGYRIRIFDPNIPSMASFSAEFEITD